MLLHKKIFLSNTFRQEEDKWYQMLQTCGGVICFCKCIIFISLEIPQCFDLVCCFHGRFSHSNLPLPCTYDSTRMHSYNGSVEVFIQKLLMLVLILCARLSRTSPRMTPVSSGMMQYALVSVWLAREW